MTLVSSFILGFGFTLGAISALLPCFILASFCKGFAQAFKKSYREAVDKKRAEKAWKQGQADASKLAEQYRREHGQGH